MPGLELAHNHFKPTFELVKRGSQLGRASGFCELPPKTLYQRLLASPDIAAATQEVLRGQHAKLNPFLLASNSTLRLKQFCLRLRLAS